MNPPVTVSPEEAVKRPTVPASVREPLLGFLAKGSTTDELATLLGLSPLATLKHLQVLERDGVVERRPEADGRDAKWWKTRRTKTGRSA